MSGEGFAALSFGYDDRNELTSAKRGGSPAWSWTLPRDDSRMPQMRYRSGEIVEEGDIVNGVNGKPGVVRMVILPGTKGASDFSAPDGGILIEEDWDGKPCFVLETPPDGAAWEDLEFVSRKGGSSGTSTAP